MNRILGFLMITATTLCLSQESIGRQNRDLQAQWRILAPLISMDQIIYLQDVTPQTIATSIKKLLDFRSQRFDADPALQSVANDFFEYMVRCETSIIPVLRMQEPSLEGAVVELLSRAMEQTVRREWQLDSDRKRQQFYKRALPIARRLAGPDMSESDPVAMSFGNSVVYVTNNSRRKMSNVTLVVRVEDFYGHLLDHYFFLPSWGVEKAEKTKRVRLSYDWGAGGKGIIKATVEALADECRIRPFIIPFRKNLEHAIEFAFARAKRNIVKNPPKCIAKLNDIKPRIRGMKRHEERLEALMTQALVNNKAYERRIKRIHSLKSRINELERRKVTLKNRIRKPKLNRQRKDRMRRNIKTIDNQISRLRSELARLQ